MEKIYQKQLQEYSFIDLFSGIGAFHQALKSFGAKCVFAADIDQHTRQNYCENYQIKPVGDITKIDESSIPKHDILCAGFPCQPFSIAGNQGGFSDTRGTLFYDILRIAAYHKPKIILLENVKNLLQHDSRQTMRVIENTLADLGYNIFYKVLSASDFSLPQKRERLYIVGFRKDLLIRDFVFPSIEKDYLTVQDILEESPDSSTYKDISFMLDLNKIDDIIQRNKAIHKLFDIKGGGQGNRIYSVQGLGITLSASSGGSGPKTGLYYIKDKNLVRTLTPREAARMQGFPEDYVIYHNPNQALKQIGNSIPITVLQAIITSIIKTLKESEVLNQCGEQ